MQKRSEISAKDFLKPELIEGDNIGMLRSNFAGDVAAVATRHVELERIGVQH